MALNDDELTKTLGDFPLSKAFMTFKAKLVKDYIPGANVFPVQASS